MDGHADKTKERQVPLRRDSQLAAVVRLTARRPILRGRFPFREETSLMRETPYHPGRAEQVARSNAGVSTFFEKSAIRIAVDRRYRM